MSRGNEGTSLSMCIEAEKCSRELGRRELAASSHAGHLERVGCSAHGSGTEVVRGQERFLRLAQGPVAAGLRVAGRLQLLRDLGRPAGRQVVLDQFDLRVESSVSFPTCEEPADREEASRAPCPSPLGESTIGNRHASWARSSCGSGCPRDRASTNPARASAA